MTNLKLEVICKNNEIKLFDKGIIGCYFYIGHPTDTEKEPEYILEVFFNENREFEGILLKDSYKEELKDCFESLLSCEVSQNIREYEQLKFISIDNNEINMKDYDVCECKKCNYVTEWNDCDIWQCEICNEYICSDCIHEYDEDAREIGISNLVDILCDTCYQNYLDNKSVSEDCN